MQGLAADDSIWQIVLDQQAVEGYCGLELVGLQAVFFQCLQDIAGDNAAVRCKVQAAFGFGDALGCGFGLHEIVGFSLDGLLLPVVLCGWRVAQFVQKLPFEMAQRGEVVLPCA